MTFEQIELYPLMMRLITSGAFRSEFQNATDVASKGLLRHVFKGL